MSVNTWIEKIEDNVDSVEALQAIAGELSADTSLSPEDREFVNERIGTYLADIGRETGDEDLLDEEGPDGQP